MKREPEALAFAAVLRAGPAWAMLAGLALVTASRGAVGAETPLPPWIEQGEVPPPSWARSVGPKPGDAGEPRELRLFAGPSGATERRGVTAAGATLPFFGEKRGSACSGRWWLVGPLAWTCSDDADLKPTDAQSPERQADGLGLSLRYFFVGPAGTSAYASLDSAREGTSDHELEGGWAVGVAEQRLADGQRWARTSKGVWLAMQDLAPARPSAFRGIAVVEGRLDFAWVVGDRAKVWSDDRPKTHPVGERARFDVVTVREDRGPMARVGDGAWMLARDLARPVLASPPAEVAHPAERWIDVDTASQTLVAYEGVRPVYATLASTGRGPPETNVTPAGVHRIWVKMVATDMDNVDREDVEEHYSMEDVPYVQFFDGAVALHGTYWHGDFGHARSHGCVNLAPLDASWLFSFTAPRLPAGWAAVYPTPLDPGTIVRVR